MSQESKIVLFKGSKIRKVIHNNEWWFSVVDVCGVLSESVDAGSYWRKLKQRLAEEGSEVVTFCHGLKLEASDGKKYETDCANTEGIFRIIQSIPSPKAEPFKRWLAKVGYERIQEIENPELATKRTRMLYKLKGYSDDWIEKRMRGIVIREELTSEWQKRGAQQESPPVRGRAFLAVQISETASRKLKDTSGLVLFLFLSNFCRTVIIRQLIVYWGTMDELLGLLCRGGNQAT